MNDTVTINTNKGNFDMEKDTFIRWLCLLEIVQHAEEKAQDLNIDLDEIDWVKPVAFKKYILERFKSMEIDILADERNEAMGINKIHHTATCHSQTYHTHVA